MLNFILKALRDFNTSFYSSVLTLVILIFIFLQVMFQHPPRIAVVNISQVVHQFVIDEAKLNLPKEVLQQRVELFGTQLEKKLEKIAKKHNVILLPREAVVTKTKDYTTELHQELMKKTKG